LRRSNPNPYYVIISLIGFSLVAFLILRKEYVYTLIVAIIILIIVIGVYLLSKPKKYF